MTKTPEAKVAAACTRYLRTRGAHVIRTGAGVGEINGRKQTFGRKGQSDHHVCYRGFWISLEEKSARGKMTSDQAAYMRHVEAAGGFTVCAWTVDDLKPVLDHIDSIHAILPDLAYMIGRRWWDESMVAQPRAKTPDDAPLFEVC